jgi:DNA-binding transcriptional ArsR family regulator
MPPATCHPLSPELIELVARRFRVLADPTRIRLLESLQEGEASVQQLTQALGCTQQNVSKQLGVLLQAGLVGRRRAGNYVFYAVADQSVFALCEHVCGSLAEQFESLRDVAAAGGEASPAA